MLVLERAPADEAGGNSRFTAGAMRVVYNGVEDLKELIPDLTDDEIAQTDFGTYTSDQFFDDMGRLTQYRCDPDLTELLVTKSFETLAWMRTKGVRFVPIWGRQAFKVDGRFKFWGGLTVETWGGGEGLVDALTQAAKKQGIDIWYSDARLRIDPRRRRCARRAREARRQNGGSARQERGACRRRLPGEPGMARALSRTRLGACQGARHALQHRRRASAWRSTSAPPRPATGRAATRSAGTGTRRSSAISRSATSSRSTAIRWGIMVNAERRALRRRGRGLPQLHLRQVRPRDPEPAGQFAWQIFDRKVLHLLARRVPHQAGHQGAAPNTLEELVTKLEDVDADSALARRSTPTTAAVKHGRAVQSQRQGRPRHA